MKKRLLLGYVVVTLLFPGLTSAFCLDPQPRLVCAEYFSSALIVEATLSQTMALHDKGDAEYTLAYVYTLRINRVLRGRAPQTIRVYEGNDSGRATFDWVPRQSYLLFLFPSPDAKQMWALDGCGNSGPLSKAAAALTEITKVKAGGHGGGMIQGMINGPIFAGARPSSGLHVEANGINGHFMAVTSADGEFRMNVPAGRYRVSVDEPGFRLYELTYEKDDLQIRPGGCAQVQFIDSDR